MRHIGEIIRELRLQGEVEECSSCGHKTKMWTQKHLAKYVGISRSFLSMVEAGDYVPSPRNIVLISRYFRKPLEYFVDGDLLEKCKKDKEHFDELLFK